jgi:hypothetical protein
LAEGVGAGEALEAGVGAVALALDAGDEDEALDEAGGGAAVVG